MGCMYATMTPPTHTPPKSEQLPPTGLELVAPWFPYIPKAIVLGLSICEITGIVACKLPSDAAVQLTELLTFSTPTTALNLGITPIFLCGWALNLAGTLFRVACYRALGRQFTFELSIRADHRLVTTGPYALVRHPSYTCAILSGVGALLAHLSRGSWVMECLDLHGLGVRRRWICVGAASIAALALVPRMNKEDGMLKKHFGKDWENWKDAVPLETAGKDAAYSAAIKLLDLLDILLRVHLGESNQTYPAAFKSDIIELRGFLTVFIQKEGNLTLDPLSPFLRIRFPLPNGPGDLALLKASRATDPGCVVAQVSSSPSAHGPTKTFAPTAQRGLPLPTLHDVFREFIIRADSPLPQCPIATAALRAADSLCGSMGDAFDESARSQAFDRCTYELFGPWQSQHHLAPPSEACSGYVHRTLESTARTIITFREDKKDIGDGGEVYMQVAREYDMYRQGCDTVGGAPAFLLCVLGPILIVSGGFYDGSNTLVEPLTRPCYMLADETGRRQQDLAQVLQRPSHELRKFPPSTPRVYLDCALYEGRESLGSLRDFEPSLSTHRLVFSATLARPSFEPERVFVKLVNRPYGEKAHRLLALHGYAPQLYGRKVLDGAPTAYVMEHLGSPWVSLYDLPKGGSSGVLRSQAVRDGIKHGIEHVISILQDATMVHGDLRANNIMIKLDGEQPVLLDSGRVVVKVVDFDWAGEAGVVRYPASRNQDIPGLRWPGLPGGVIQAQHDRELFESWWPSFSSL
ncbi:hypothetical protein EYR36_003349 [Pleurotus pulmonarius]|nr:hypothetical protein EYR36_003349 [Pleurotus pulmonarius]